VVGASASGVQIADELQRSGRQVTLSVGEHVRVPRTYRGHDILWWLDHLGILDERWDEIDDVVRARHLPSLQLVGGTRTLDLNILQETGVRVVGRFAGIRDDVAQLSGALPNICALADLKLGRLLNAIDLEAGGRGDRPEPTALREKPPLGLKLGTGEFRSVVWATGIGHDFSWVDVPVFDHRGRLVHEGGVTRWPGLYVLGLPMLRRRRSSYLDGARLDVADLAGHLTDSLKEAS
jgi:putative flavoprotein involved in K+ transport